MSSQSDSCLPVTIETIRQAAVRLAPVVVKTPLLESPYLNEIAGRRVLVKAEVLQRTGSFKFRGAWSAISALDEQTRARGVIAYSSGNHAQGIAHAANLHGIPATVIMPADSPAMKLSNTQVLGATVVTYDRAGGESREAVGEALAEKHGLTLIRPYDEPMVIAGQGTCGLEIAEQAAAVGVEEADVMVCCGGGGLSAGIAIALDAIAKGLRVRPVEPTNADDTCRSLLKGERVANVGNPDSICDAIVTPTPGELTFPVLQALAGAGISVSDEQVLNAMKLAMLRLKLVVEPGGAVALAAALDSSQSHGDAVVCVVTGGNVDIQLLTHALGVVSTDAALG